MSKIYGVLSLAILLGINQTALGQNLTVAGASVTVKGGASVTIEGNFKSKSNGTISNNGLINLNGNFSNDGSTQVFQAGDTGVVLLYNDLLQTIGGTNSSLFNKLVIDATAAQKEVRLTNDATCDLLLDLNDDFLATQGNTFTVDNDAANALLRDGEMIAPFSDTLRGYVTSTGAGKLTRKTSAGNTYLFPLVESGKFRPVEIQSSAPNYYEADFVNAPPANQASLGTGIFDVNPNYYHKISRQNATGSTDNITVHLDFDVDGACINNDLTLAEYDGTNWTNLPNTVNTQRATPLLSSVSQPAYPGSYSTPYNSENFAIGKLNSDGNPDWEQDSCFTECQPTVTCPADTVLNNDASNCSAVLNFTIDTSLVNCPSLTLTRVQGLASGSAFPVGLTVNTFKVEDGQGTTASCSFNITVNDNEAPAISCPSNMAANNDLGLCSALVNYTAPAGTDNCTGAITTRSSGAGSGAAFPVGTNTEFYIVTDLTGKTATCSFDIVIADNENPVAVCQDLTVALDQNGDAAVSAVQVNDNSSDNCAISSLLLTPITFNCNDVGDNPVSLTVTDNSANSATCTATVTVTNANNLLISCPVDTTINNDINLCSSVHSYATVTASSNCSGATVSQSSGLSSSSAFPVGATVNLFTASDISGATNSCAFTVTVIDAESPSIVCPSDQIVGTAAGLCAQTVNYTTPNANDNCPGVTVTRTGGPASGSTFNLGLSTVEFTATDGTGSTGTCSFSISVVDLEDPIINCPGNQSLNSDPGNCGAVFNYTVTFADNCAGLNLSQSSGLVSGASFPGGTTVNSFVVTDTAGNQANCSFGVTVIDNEAPQITCPGDTILFVDQGLCATAFNYATPVATDNCPSPITSLVSGLSSGASFSRGLHAIVYKVTDGASNSDTCNFTVIVKDDQAPVLTCPGNQNVAANGSGCTATVNYPSPAVSDNCSGATVTLLSGVGNGGTFPFGISTETYVGFDVSANSDTCTFDIIVSDSTGPVALCQNAAITAVGNDSIYVEPLFIDSGSYDLCGLDSIYLTPSFFDCDNLGTNNTAVLTVSDLSGNISTCSANITVVLRGLQVNGHTKISDLSGNFSGTLANKDFMGNSLAHIGDIDADGIDDVVTGAPKDDDGPGSDRGAVWVMFLDAQNEVDGYQKISQTAGGFTGNLSAGDWFGWSTANLGDVNGDGITDIICGAPQDDDGGNNRGAAWILHLDNDGTVKSHQKISHFTNGISLANADKFGSSVANIGDLNNDGYTDIAIGSPKSNVGGTDKGRFHILFMGANGLPSSVQAISGSSFPLGNNPLSNKDEFGTAIAGIGDLNGDGVLDLAVSAAKDDDLATNTGAVYILFMNSDGTISASQKISATVGGLNGQLQTGDLFGQSLASGVDINNDGFDDLLVGAESDDDGGSDKGATWVLLLNSNGTVTQTLKISDTQSNFAGVVDKYDNFGSAVTLFETNSCGATIGIGANNDDDGGTNRGAFYILEVGSGPAKTDEFAQEEVVPITPHNAFSTNEEEAHSVWLYPNPNMGQFQIEIADLDEEQYEIFLVSQIGEEIEYLASDPYSGHVTESFDIAHLPAGMYYVTLKIETAIYTWKVLSLR